jgi:hypothetical protein
MMKFKVIEIRKNQKGEEFVVESLHECEREKALRWKLDNEKPSRIVDKNYRIKKVDK